MREKIFEDLLKIWAKAKARLRKSDKWETVTELRNLLYDFNTDDGKDDEAYSKLNAKMKFLCEAPHIGFCICIFRYKGLLVALEDNPHCSEVKFYSVATAKDFLIAKGNDIMNKIGRTLLWKFRWKRIQE